jgi:hypothetical protein
MTSSAAGFSLVELLVAGALAGLLMAGGIGLFTSHYRAYDTEDSRVGMEENLRVAMTVLTDSVRSAGGGVPTANLSAWIPWYTGFGTDPVAVGTTPASITVARCFGYSVARLTSSVAAGADTIDVSSGVSGRAISDLLDANTKSLVFIDGREHAHITAVNGNRLSLDTNPLKANAQGLSRAYPIGTTLCRVEVLTYFVETNTVTGRPELRVDNHEGGEAQSVAEGIAAIQVTTLSAGESYQIGLSADADMVDRLSGATLTGSLLTNVTMRN